VAFPSKAFAKSKIGQLQELDKQKEKEQPKLRSVISSGTWSILTIFSRNSQQHELSATVYVYREQKKYNQNNKNKPSKNFKYTIPHLPKYHNIGNKSIISMVGIVELKCQETEKLLYTTTKSITNKSTKKTQKSFNIFFFKVSEGIYNNNQALSHYVGSVTWIRQRHNVMSYIISLGLS
jgi:ribosomal protein L33